MRPFGYVDIEFAWHGALLVRDLVYRIISCIHTSLFCLQQVCCCIVGKTLASGIMSTGR